jgi:hypothetical protein
MNVTGLLRVDMEPVENWSYRQTSEILYVRCCVVLLINLGLIVFHQIIFSLVSSLAFMMFFQNTSSFSQTVVQHRCPLLSCVSLFVSRSLKCSRCLDDLFLCTKPELTLDRSWEPFPVIDNDSCALHILSQCKIQWLYKGVKQIYIDLYKYTPLCISGNATKQEPVSLFKRKILYSYCALLQSVNNWMAYIS